MLELNENAIHAILAALRRGNNVELRRKGDSVIVMEVKRKIIHRDTLPN